MMENKENNNLIIRENGEAVFESEDGIIEKDSFTKEQMESIRSITSNSATIIKNNAFKIFKYLETIYLPSINAIGKEAFLECEKLAEIRTSTQEQCEQIYSMLNEELKRKARSNDPNNKLTIYYGNEVFQPPETEKKRKGKTRTNK